MTSSQLPPMARPRISAGALFTDADGRVLLVRPTTRRTGTSPAGTSSPESHRSRRASERSGKLGITPPVNPQTFVVDWAPAEGEGDKILLIFDGGHLSDNDLDAVTFADGEIAEVRYVSTTELDSYVPGRLARRIHSALVAQRQGHPIYAEHGTPV